MMKIRVVKLDYQVRPDLLWIDHLENQLNRFCY